MRKKLLAEQFRDDKRVIEAKRLILEALDDVHNRFPGVQSGTPKKKEGYEALIERLGGLRGSPLYFPYLSSGLGKGPLVELADGSVKYDLISGIGVHNWGHSHRDLVAAGIDAALEDTVMQGNLQQSSRVVQLTESIVSAATSKGAKLDYCFLTSSGAMANENALKLIFHKKHPANRILCFANCFAGRTLALSQLTDKPAYRIGLPINFQIDYIPFFDSHNPKESTRNSISTLKNYLSRYPGQHACMCFELVQGEGGYYPGDRRFFLAIMEILKKNEISIFIDEIQTFGRTYELFAYQHFGLDSFVDIVTIGKMTQVCATLFPDSYKPKRGLISQTFTASTSAIVAAQVIFNHLDNGGFFGVQGKNARLHKYFVDRLEHLVQQYHETIYGPYGIGAMVAFSIFDGSLEKTKAFVQALFEQGVIAFLAGQNPTRVRFLLPTAVLTNEDIAAIADIIEVTIKQMGNK